MSPRYSAIRNRGAGTGIRPAGDWPMTQTVRSPGAEPPASIIEAAIARHGPWRVLLAAGRAILARRRDRPPPLPELSLSDHLRRDVGLEPEVFAPKHWEL